MPLFAGLCARLGSATAVTLMLTVGCVPPAFAGGPPQPSSPLGEFLDRVAPSDPDDGEPGREAVARSGDGKSSKSRSSKSHGEKAARSGRAGKGRADRRRSPGAIAAAAAMRKLGTPFSWGGGSPRGATLGIGRGAGTVGFDCSGLALYAWSKAGIRLGHYTGTQFRQGRRIALGKLRRGDLVFFGGGRGDPTHVGLYLRHGVMIHAPRTGDVVRRTDFRGSDYYRARYRGAVRPA